MEYVRFGRTGVQVSRLGFGGAPAGLRNYLEEYDPELEAQRDQVLAALERAVKRGITYFDTAASYGNGTSESIFGEALAPYSTRLFIATKYGIRQPQTLRESLERSLVNLRRSYVDLLQFHGGHYTQEQADAILRPGGLLDEMEALRDEGLIRFVGFTSEDNNPAVYRFIETGRFDTMQICYNLLAQHPHEPSRPFGSMLEADKHDMGIATMRTVTSGLFQKWIRMVNPDNTFDYTPALLQFVLSSPLVDVALVGMRDPEIVDRNADIVEDTGGRIDFDELFARYV